MLDTDDVFQPVIIRFPSHYFRASWSLYRGADKSLARLTSRCILFNSENISFDASLDIYIYIYSTNIDASLDIYYILYINTYI